MANEIFKKLNTRIALKYNTYDYWVNGDGKDYAPLKGEVCFCEIPAGNNEATTAPTMLFKVGVDGEKKFSELKWGSALAADVYSWAKAKTVELVGEKLTFKNADGSTAGEVDLSIFATDAIVGNLENLNTTVKTDLVTAINEVLTAVDAGGTGSVVTIAKLETPTEGSAETYQLYQGGKAVGEKIEIPVSTKVEASDKNGYIKVDDEDVVVYDEIFGVDMATVNALGGIAAGTNLKDKTIHEVLNALLFPYVKPTVGTPSRTPNTTSALEKGNDQTITSVSVTVTKKSEPITKVELCQGSTVLATKEGDEVKNGGTFTFSGLSVAVPSSSVTLTVKVTDAKGSVVTSGATAGWTFVYPYFYGVCAGDKTAATLTEADIEAMTKDIKAKGEKSYTYTTDGQKMVIAYPKAHGALKKALDPNGFDYLGDYDRAELNITGLDGSAQTYYVYAQKAPSFVTSFTMKYQY
jgi:hypothetical protein